MPSIPHLTKTAQGGHHLLVDGKPFLIQAGELQNSSFSSAAYMKPLWPKLIEDGVNTVFVGVHWCDIEEEEGKFEFEEFDEALKGATEVGMKVVPLWFGSYKNGMSTYIPTWMKRDAKRFPRARIHNPQGGNQIAEVLSLFHENNVNADIKAFTAFMEHVKEVDEGKNTIIMIQVENEVGLLGASRDLGKLATGVYEKDVPREFVKSIIDKWDVLHPALIDGGLGGKKPSEQAGSWGEVFGASKRADEMFMAYHYALYLDKITKAGKSIYPLPMYTNCWISSHTRDFVETAKAGFSAASGGDEPGDWPSGGPNIGVLDIWIDNAPNIDFFSPDIYLHHYGKICEAYTHRGNILFIPEQRRDAFGLRWMWEGYGRFGALSVSPFGIDSLEEGGEGEGEGRDLVREHFKLLDQVRFYVLQSQANPGSCFGFWFHPPNEDNKGEVRTVKLGNWDLTIQRSTVPGTQAAAYGMIVPLQGSDDRFLLVGVGYSVTWKSTNPSALFSGIAHYHEKSVVNAETGELKTVRKFNGDETMSGKTVSMPSLNPDAGRLPVAIFIKAGTRITEVGVYEILEE